MDQVSEPKWEATVSKRLARASAHQVWPIFADFFNLHKWFPNLATCYGVHGTNGEPGCVRFCSGFSVSSQGGGGEKWAKERLISIDHVGRSLSYEIVESNIGFSSYVANFKVVPAADDQQDGCVIEWSFSVTPVEGWKFDDFKKKYETGLQGLAKKIEDGIFQT